MPTFLLLALAVVAWPASRLLAAAAWPIRRPRLAVTVWIALLSGSWSAAILAILSASHDVWEPLGAWLMHTTTSSMHEVYAGDSDAAHAAALLLLAPPLGVIAVAARLRAASSRAHVAGTHVLSVARPGPVINGQVTYSLSDRTPRAFCLARPQAVILSTGALRMLGKQHLAAVVAHEQAHLAAGDHRLRQLAAAAGDVLPVTPHRRFARSLHLLQEFAADDIAGRAHGRIVVAQALVTVAASPTGLNMGAQGRDLAVRASRLTAPAAKDCRLPVPASVLAGMITAGVVMITPAFSIIGQHQR